MKIITKKFKLLKILSIMLTLGCLLNISSTKVSANETRYVVKNNAKVTCTDCGQSTYFSKGTSVTVLYVSGSNAIIQYHVPCKYASHQTAKMNRMDLGTNRP